MVSAPLLICYFFTLICDCSVLVPFHNLSLFFLPADGPSSVLNMDNSHCCDDCGAALQADDDHDLYPACVGHDHLVDALSENYCINFSYMLCVERVAWLAQLRCKFGNGLLPSWKGAPPRHSMHLNKATVSVGPFKKRQAKSDQGIPMRV